jgi:hypothetical protein
MKSVYLLSFSILFLASCKSSSTNSTEVVTMQSPEKEGFEDTYCKELSEVKTFEDSTLYSSAMILSYTLEEGCVCIKYQYSGCNESESVLTWNGNYLQNTRPEIMMNLWVKSPGYCDMLLTDSICFSLKPMQFVGNEILLMLNKRQNNLVIKY